MRFFSGLMVYSPNSQPILNFVKDEAYRAYSAHRSGAKKEGVFLQEPLTAKAVNERPFALNTADGKPANAVITVGSALAVSDEGRAIFEAFDRQSCSFWPVNLFSKAGVDFGTRYWIVHTSKVIAAEYNSKEWKMWWGDKIAGFNDLTMHNYGMGGWPSDNYDFFSPTMLDFRPVAERVQAEYELCHNEVVGHHFWRSFVFGNDHYYFSSEFHEVIQPLCPWAATWEYRTCRKVWRPEERMKPLLDWIEAKEERKAEWAGYYPDWTKRYRPQWIIGS